MSTLVVVLTTRIDNIIAFTIGNRHATFRYKLKNSIKTKTFISSIDQVPDEAPLVSDLLSENQQLHTAERLAGMSRGEINHIFQDVDADGSGVIDFAELDLLSKYFGESSGWSLEKKRQIMADIDEDKNGNIDGDEFYKWMVLNIKSQGAKSSEGTMMLKAREERLALAEQKVPKKMTDLLDEVSIEFCIYPKFSVINIYAY